jgi:hypothetical protein
MVLIQQLVVIRKITLYQTHVGGLLSQRRRTGEGKWPLSILTVSIDLHRLSGQIYPIEIFRAVPALAGTPNDLWQGQSKALELWHNNRHLRDTLISLHTGAGKSIVGLLIAQSLINEGVPKVLYVCATNDLVSQTSREIETKLGFTHSTRVAGRFSNDSYSTGEGVSQIIKPCSIVGLCSPETIDLARLSLMTLMWPRR